MIPYIKLYKKLTTGKSKVYVEILQVEHSALPSLATGRDKAQGDNGGKHDNQTSVNNKNEFSSKDNLPKEIIVNKNNLCQPELVEGMT